MVAKHNVGESCSIDNAVDHDRRPGFRHLVVGCATGFEHAVTNVVSIDDQSPPRAQQFTDDTLPGADPAGEQNPYLILRHDE